MQEAVLYEEISRGQTAKDLLNNKLLKDALEAVEAAALEEWKETDKDAFSQRERMWQKLQVIEEFRQDLTRHIETGALAKAQMKRKKRS